MRRHAAPTARSQPICGVPPTACETAATKAASICGDADPPPVLTSLAVHQLPQCPIVRVSVDTTALFDLSRRATRCEWVPALPKRKSLASPRPLSGGCDSTLGEPRNSLRKSRANGVVGGESGPANLTAKNRASHHFHVGWFEKVRNGCKRKRRECRRSHKN
jgi:hypothetical protein